MDDLRDLYQQTVLEHARNPRNHRAIEEHACSADGYNPLCGDKLQVFVRVEGDRIADLSFLGEGCAISQASASLMTEALMGKTLADAERMGARVQELLTGDGAPDPELGKLEIFQGVREFPMRVKCATLAWHTLRAALKEERS